MGTGAQKKEDHLNRRKQDLFLIFLHVSFVFLKKIAVHEFQQHRTGEPSSL